MKDLVLNKKLIICFGVLIAVLLIAVILNFTLFSLSDVELQFQNNTQIYASEEAKNVIKQNENIEQKTSVFFLDKNNLKEKLENDYHNLKIINIETVFPNKIILHCAERQEHFAIKAGENRYFITDGDFKVLDIEYQSYISTNTNAILVTGLESVIRDIHSVNEGDFLQFSSQEEVLKNLATSLEKNNKTVAMQKAFIKTLNFDSGRNPITLKDQPFLNVFDFNDFQSKIYLLEDKLADKFAVMFSVISNVVYNVENFFDETQLANPQLLDKEYYKNYNLIISGLTQSLIRLEKII